MLSLAVSDRIPILLLSPRPKSLSQANNHRLHKWLVWVVFKEFIEFFDIYFAGYLK
jgi:hypothetical protein